MGKRYVLNRFNPFTLSTGFLTLSLFAFLAAAYLVVEAPSEELRRTFRYRAAASAVAGSVLAVDLLAQWVVCSRPRGKASP